MEIEQHTDVDVSIWARNSAEIDLRDIGENGTAVLFIGRFGHQGARVYFPGQTAFDTICALHAKMTAWIREHAPPRSVAANVTPAIPPEPEPPNAA